MSMISIPRCLLRENYLKHAVMIIVVQDPHMFLEHVGAILHDVGHELTYRREFERK